jgi:peptidyl-prolyl cis-trans isomerase B (cyclophilin B)
VHIDKILTLVLCAFLSIAPAGCGNSDGGAGRNGGKSEGDKVMITITMADDSVMKLELYPDIAPKTVENFVSLAKEGFYDGLTFHRIIKGFMIQGGDPLGNGTGGSKKTIKGEFASNGVKNDLSHTRGVISMARSKDPNSASSQFFIVHEDSPHLDGDYAAFGKLVEGYDVLDRLAQTPVKGDTPIEKPVIKSIRVDE